MTGPCQAVGTDMIFARYAAGSYPRRAPEPICLVPLACRIDTQIALYGRRRREATDGLVDIGAGDIGPFASTAPIRLGEHSNGSAPRPRAPLWQIGCQAVPEHSAGRVR